MPDYSLCLIEAHRMFSRLTGYYQIEHWSVPCSEVLVQLILRIPPIPLLIHPSKMLPNINFSRYRMPDDKVGIDNVACQIQLRVIMIRNVVLDKHFLDDLFGLGSGIFTIRACVDQVIGKLIQFFLFLSRPGHQIFLAQ